MGIAENYTELLADIYNLRGNLCTAVDDHMYMSHCCVNSNDTIGIYYHDGMSTAYDTVVHALSALLDKAESGR